MVRVEASPRCAQCGSVGKVSFYTDTPVTQQAYVCRYCGVKSVLTVRLDMTPAQVVEDSSKRFIGSSKSTVKKNTKHGLIAQP